MFHLQMKTQKIVYIFFFTGKHLWQTKFRLINNYFFMTETLFAHAQTTILFSINKFDVILPECQ